MMMMMMMMMIADDDSREPAGWAPSSTPAAPGDAHEDLLPALPVRAVGHDAGLQVSTVQYSRVQYRSVTILSAGGGGP